MANSESFMGTQVVRPYTKELLQVTIPRELAAMLRLEAGNRLWVKTLDDGLAFVINGPLPQINPPRGRVKDEEKENTPPEEDDGV